MASVDVDVGSAAGDGQVSVESDNALLESYASQPKEFRDRRIAVVQAAGRARGSRGVQAARNALSVLAAEDPPYGESAVMNSLLDVAAAGTKVDDVSTFIVSSAAWKALTAAALMSNAELGIRDVNVQGKILCNAGAAVASVVREIQRTASNQNRSSGDGLNGSQDTGLEAMSRLVKIARFHGVNAARCAMRFAEQDTVLSAEEPCVVIALQNLALLLRLSLVGTDSVPGFVSDDLEKQVLSPCAAAARAVLVMCSDAEQVGRAIKGAYSENVIAGVSQREISGCVLAVAYLSRLAIDSAPCPSALSSSLIRDDCTGCDAPRIVPSIENNAGQPDSLRCRDWPQPKLNGVLSNVRTRADDKPTSSFRLGKMLCSCLELLLRVLFDVMSGSYAEFFEIRDKSSTHSLLDVLLSAAASCAVRCDNIRSETCGSLEWLVLEYAATQHPIVSFVAAEVAMVLLCSRQENPREQLDVFMAVMAIARCSEAAGKSCSDSQWLPLAARMAKHLYSIKRLTASDLFPDRAPQENNRRNPNAPKTAAGRANILFDSVGLEVLSRLCVESCIVHDSGQQIAVTAESTHPGSAGVVQNLGIPTHELSSFVKANLLGNGHGGRLACACARLLPFTCDARTAAGAAIACIKRPTSPTMLVVIALNSLNPGTMPEASLGAVAAEALRMMQQHGRACVPAMAGFVARMASHLHRNVSLASWSKFALVVNSLVNIAQVDTGSEESVIFNAAAMQHMATTLSVTASIARESSNIKAGMPPESLATVESAHERSFVHLQDAKAGNHVSSRERETRSREADLAIGRRSTLSSSSAGKSESYLDLLGPALADLTLAITKHLDQAPKSHLPAALAAEFKALKTIASNLCDIASSSESSA